MKINVKFKKLHPDAQMPVRAKDGDTCYDITCIDNGTWSEDGRYIHYRTGLAFELPPGYGIEARPRSSNSKFDLLLCNSVATLDNHYRGEVGLRFRFVPPIKIGLVNNCEPSLVPDKPWTYLMNLYKKGDKIAQLKIEEVIEADWEEATELSETDRADGGFGHTGR